MIHLRKLFKVILSMQFILTGTLNAATILQVNEENSRAIVSLNRDEMASIKLNKTFFLEIYSKGDFFIISGIFKNLNPVKRTVLFVAEDADERLSAKQNIVIIAKIQNLPLSPLVRSYSQYFEYSKTSVSGGASVIYDSLTQMSSDSEQKSQAQGFQLAANTYLPVVQQKFGLGLGIIQTIANIKTTATTGIGTNSVTTIQSPEEYKNNKIEAGFWSYLQPKWILGFRIDYSMIDTISNTDASTPTTSNTSSQSSSQTKTQSFEYDVAESIFSVTHFSDDYEQTVRYKSPDNVKATSSARVYNGVKGETRAFNVPGTLEYEFHSIQSANFAWGLGVGYLLYTATSDSANEDYKAKATTPELLLLQSNLQHRLGNGDQVDYIANYFGGKSMGRTKLQQVTNTARMTVIYTHNFGNSWYLGVNTIIEAGKLSRGSDQSSSQPVNSGKKSSSFGGVLQVFTHKDIDFNDRRLRK